MGTDSKIEWTTHTWNPWYGCPDDGARSPACDHCYARAWAKRSGIVDFDREIKRASDATFFAPLNQKKYKPGDRVFVCSLSDFFHGEIPVELYCAAFEVMSARPDLTFIILTKRPQNIDPKTNWIKQDELPTWQNLWLGVTAENQEQADARIPALLAIPAAKRFVSIEPMMGPITLDRWLPGSWFCESCSGYYLPNELDDPPENKFGGHLVCRCGAGYDNEELIAPEESRHPGWLDWVIVGGESGPGARPIRPEWVRSIRDQCQAAGVPFFFKQWGDNPLESAFEETDGINAWTGLPRCGNLLDGKIWQEFPK